MRLAFSTSCVMSVVGDVLRGVDEAPKWRLSRECPDDNAILFGYRGPRGVNLINGGWVD